MPDYHLNELNDRDFQNLVVHICKDWFGEGVSSFTAGRDGGRDATFTGTANRFPSEQEPVKGQIVIQAKWTSNPIASCSNSEFAAIIKKEIPKIRKLAERNLLDAYMLFTNRKKTAGANESIVAMTKKETGVEKIWLRGKEEIESYLQVNPSVVQMLGLDRLRQPFIIHPDNLATLIREFQDNKDVIDRAICSKMNFPFYPGIDEKNRVNNLSKGYFQYIKEKSEPYFTEISEFLRNPRNEELLDAYHNIADEFQSKLMVHRDKFDVFDSVFEYIYDEILKEQPELNGSSRLINVFMHYMYCHCDFGKNKK